MKGDANPVWKQEFRCKFIKSSIKNAEQCNLLFSTQNQLYEHRRAKGYLKRKKKLNATEERTKAQAGKKKLRIDDLFLANVPHIEDTLAVKNLCGICKADGDEDGDGGTDTHCIDWVACRNCGQWYHQTCVEKGMPDNLPSKKKKWFCCY